MMKINRKYWSFGIITFATLIIGTTVLSGCLQHETNSHPQLYMGYHYTAEATYQDIEINQSKLIYTYFPEEVAKERCAMLSQVPCWTGGDLRTKEVVLSKGEIDEMIDLIDQAGFMNLENRYGPDNNSVRGLRCYPYILSVKIGKNEKEVVYCERPVSPVSPPMPEAFKKVKDELFKLIDKKFK